MQKRIVCDFFNSFLLNHHEIVTYLDYNGSIKTVSPRGGTLGSDFMNQNNRNESDRVGVSESDAFHSEQTQYTTTNGGSGVHYHADRRAYAAGSTGRTASSRANGKVTVALILLLCLTLGFGMGMTGARLMNLAGQSALSGNNDTLPDSYQGTKFPGSSDSAVTPGQTSGDVERKPSPTLQKSDPLDRLTYSGSAGDRAFATLAQAIETVENTVVEISTETVVSGGWLGNYVSSGAGSGVIIAEEGYIITNYHVIDGADVINIRMTDGTTYAASVVGKDSASDIAVLWIDAQGAKLQAASLGCSADLIVGEAVFAIGNPLGSLGGTVTNGIISATARNIMINGESMTLLQTNAAVNPGNSGGGLFNMAGQLIGVVNAKCSEDDVEGLGFAIPVDTAYEVIQELIEYGYVRGKIDHGLRLYDVTESHLVTAWRYFQSNRAGVYVLESAYCKELQYADLITGVNGVDVSSAAQFEAALSGCAVGDTVTLTVVRAEKEYHIDLTLREYVPSDLDVQFTQNTK